MQSGFCLRKVCAPLAIAALVVLVLALGASAQAPDAAGSGKLESIRVSGSTKYRSEQIAPATGLAPGATISKDDLQQGADRLGRLGLFASVQYRYESPATGVRVEYQVKDAPLMPVWFDNFPWFTDDEIIAALKHDVPLFDGTAPEHGSILDDLSDSLEKLLVTRNIHSKVSHTISTAPTSSEQVQSFRAEDSVMDIAAIEFSDPLAQSDRSVQQRLPDLVGKPYSRSLIEMFAFEQVRPIYISHAFLRVKFGSPVARIAGDGANTRITVAVPIDPGPAFAWDGVTWHENLSLTSADLDKLVAIKSGDPADGSKIEAAWQRVRDDYYKRGHLDVDLTITPQFDDTAKHVAYDVTVNEGPQYHMGKLVLTGLSIDGERRVRAAWKIPEDAVLDKSVYDDFLDNGIKQAFSGLPVHYEKVGRYLQEDAHTSTVDVMLDFQ